MTAFFGFIGGRVLDALVQQARFARLLLAALYWTFVRPFQGHPIRRAETIHQMRLIGADSLPIVALIAWIIGLILAMQAIYQLSQFGAEVFTGAMVGVSVCRELGPLMVAVVLAGRIGASMAAELGTMRVSEEIDALEVMALNPIRFLVVPRLIAIVIMTPLLTMLADACGMIGGMMYSYLYAQMDPLLYQKMTFDFLKLGDDVLTGLGKAAAFGAVIGIVGCYKGLNVTGGAEGVGRATTEAVVSSIFLIVIVDGLATALTVF